MAWDPESPRGVMYRWSRNRDAWNSIELPIALIRGVTAETMEEFCRVVPPELIEECRALVDRAPNSEDVWEEWGNQESIFGGYIGGPWDEEAAKASRERSAKKFRTGVETLREFFARNYSD